MDITATMNGDLGLLRKVRVDVPGLTVRITGLQRAAVWVRPIWAAER
jgi:hypothetical protein